MLMVMEVRYTSTRNAGISRDIADAIVQGMPEDGGLFVPSHIPALRPEARFEPKLTYADLAWLVMSPYFDWSETELRPLLAKAYSTDGGRANFTVPEIAPLVPAGSLEPGETGERSAGGVRPLERGVGEGAPLFLLELFHGKTCAFKDIALSLLGDVLRVSLDKRGVREPVLILTATSGDTGSAALAGLGGQQGIRIAVIYPSEGTSEIQRLQMTSVPREGRFVTGLRGNFDDAQRAVKRIFQTASASDSPFKGIRLSSANSINIGRLLPQIVYYVKAWRDLRFSGVIEPEGSFDVVVPSGNFGDILAAKYAKLMGLPIRRLVCASNSNKILHDFFTTGVYDRHREFSKTLSPSMDILVSSNLERLLYHTHGKDAAVAAARTAELMREFETVGRFELTSAHRARISDFSAGWADDGATIAMIRHMWQEHGVLVDPHTAVACEVAHKQWRGGSEHVAVPVVVAATASPFKFPIPCLSALQGLSPATFKAGEDLELARQLSAITGKPMPKAIAALEHTKILHTAVAEDATLVPSLAAFARSSP